MSLMKNFPTQLWETKEENRTRKLINKKPSEFDKEMREENQKIIDIINEKSFNLDLGQR